MVSTTPGSVLAGSRGPQNRNETPQPSPNPNVWASKSPQSKFPGTSSRYCPISAPRPSRSGKAIMPNLSFPGWWSHRAHMAAVNEKAQLKLGNHHNKKWGNWCEDSKPRSWPTLWPQPRLANQWNIKVLSGRQPIYTRAPASSGRDRVATKTAGLTMVSPAPMQPGGSLTRHRNPGLSCWDLPERLCRPGQFQIYGLCWSFCPPPLS